MTRSVDRHRGALAVALASIVVLTAWSLAAGLVYDATGGHGWGLAVTVAMVAGMLSSAAGAIWAFSVLPGRWLRRMRSPVPTPQQRRRVW